jgi:U32 family peptidase
MTPNKPFRPELLLPVGNAEAYHAAIDGGANAIYLGLQSFNARSRANNFTPWQVAAIVKESHKKRVKVYITLNTVIRNNELNSLINTLFILSQIKPDAIIIQDWGVYYLARKYFPQLNLHASTQMAIHNSAGVNYSAKMGIMRVVLARELTQPELISLAKNPAAELELFVHGALCYSFSGMCLFSSYLGGASANRGMCAQPCRRIYVQNTTDNYLFSLKDNQLIDHLPLLEQLRITSLKVEGRLKSAEYVHQVAKAYRKAIDHPQKRKEAKQELAFDFGREKTDYFLGKELGNAITQSTNTGLLIGKIITIEDGLVCFSSTVQLDANHRLRFRCKTKDRQTDLKISDLKKTDDLWCFNHSKSDVALNDEVYLIGKNMKFPSSIKTEGIKINDRCPELKMRTIKSSLTGKSRKDTRTTVYIRIDHPHWLKELHMNDFDGIILNFTQIELEKFDPKQAFIQQNKKKVWIELPKFIAEGNLNFYRTQLQRYAQSGILNFSISHLSQKELMPKNANLMANENIYTFNDAAIKLIKDEGVSTFIYPFENDIVNLAKGNFRNGITALFYYPNLFYSRMPIKAEKESLFKDNNGQKFRKIVRDGMTIVLPEKPVSLTQYKQKLDRYGFSNYLIDLSFVPPSKTTASEIRKKLLTSEAVETGNIFNFKRELK